MNREQATFGNVTFLKSEGALLLCYGASLLQQALATIPHQIMRETDHLEKRLDELKIHPFFRD